MKPLAVIPRRAVTPLKQATPSRSPTATPPASQQVTANATQPSLVGMSKEEKAAEMNRRKEERKQVSGAEFTEPVPGADNTVTAHCPVEGAKSFRWEGVKHASCMEGPLPGMECRSHPRSWTRAPTRLSLPCLAVVIDGITFTRASFESLELGRGTWQDGQRSRKGKGLVVTIRPPSTSRAGGPGSKST